jgi:hypothetical protein
VSDTQARLDAIRGLVEGISWGGSTDISGNRDDVDRLIVDDVPWLLAELERVTAALRNETLISNEYAQRLREAWNLLDEGLAVENTSVGWRERVNALRGMGDHLAVDVAALAGGARAAQENKP